MTWDGHGFLLCVIHWRGFWYSHGSPCGPQNLRAFTKTAQINSLSLSFRKVCVLLSVYTWPRLLITYVRILETWRFLLLFPPCKIIFASYSSLGCISPFFQVCFPEKLSPTMLLLHCLQFFIKALCSFSMKHLSKLVICIFLCAVFFFFQSKLPNLYYSLLYIWHLAHSRLSIKLHWLNRWMKLLSVPENDHNPDLFFPENSFASLLFSQLRK